VGTATDATGTGDVYTVPHWVASVARPLVMVLATALSYAYWRGRARHRPHDALLLLAFLFLVRCLLDPFTISYHHAPFVLALLAWEALRRRGLPVLSIYTAAGLWAISALVAPLQDPSLLFRAYVAWALPLAVYLGLALYAPRRARAWETALRLPRPTAPA
jgi:hypothetical protein